MSTLDLILHEEQAPALAWPEPLPDHLSASQLSMLMRCPEQYRRRYVAGLMERPAAALVWGKADHQAHETNFRQKIDSHTDLPVDDIKVAFAEAFDQASDDDIDWGADKPGELKDKGVELVALYHQQVSPKVQPTAVEERFELRIPGVPVPVVGFIDVIEDARGIERKTAKQKASTVKPRWLLQGLLYQLVERKPIEWHVCTKTKLPAVYTPETEPGLVLPESALETTQRYVANAAAHAVALLERFGPDQPWPGAIADDWACSYCGWGPNGSRACAWWQR